MASQKFIPNAHSAPNKNLRVGEYAVCLYESFEGRLVTITERQEARVFGKTRTQYRVKPTLYGCKAEDWFDSEWFRVATASDIAKLGGTRNGARGKYGNANRSERSERKQAE